MRWSSDSSRSSKSGDWRTSSSYRKIRLWPTLARGKKVKEGTRQFYNRMRLFIAFSDLENSKLDEIEIEAASGKVRCWGTPLDNELYFL